jgi:hypothetical protein
MSYCEMPEFYREHRCKARREHRCCETGRTIRKGEYYWRCTGKWDGEFRAYKQSESAYHFARHLNIDIHGECEAGFGYVSDDICSNCLETEDLYVIWHEIERGEREWGPYDCVPGYEREVEQRRRYEERCARA